MAHKVNIEDFLPDRLPIDVLPYSNQEFIPPPPTREQKAIMKIAMEECDRAARKHGLSRRRFLQTGAAYAVCLWAINKVMGRGYALAQDGCFQAPIGKDASPTSFPLEFPAAERENLPGEFIMDLQTHHVDASGTWRARNPGEEAFFAAVFGGAQCRAKEIDPIECLGRVHYLKELFLDSATNVTILSAVPFEPDGQPLPIEQSAKTADLVRNLAGGTRRTYIHRFAMPNRGSAGNRSDSILGANGVDPLFMQEEFDLMEETAATYGGSDGPFRAWKIYTPWGDVPYTSGWWLDDPVGLKFIQHVENLSNRYNVPALICAHKGFALPAFDQEKAATRDVGVVAPQFQNVTFIIYHSGFDGDGLGLGGPLNQGTSAATPYPGPDAAPSTDRGVDNFITALVENGWSARHFALGKVGIKGLEESEWNPGPTDPKPHGNVPNVYAELGSVWGNVMNNPARASNLLGKLIFFVGAKRIVWGTDALWGGSPQGEITTLRDFVMNDQIKELYNLPHGLEGDVDDPTQPATDPSRTIRNGILGRNSAGVYRIDPDRALQAITCDQLQELRNNYLLNPMAQHQRFGPRTRRELFARLRQDPWHRGAVAELNSRGFRKRSA